MYLIWILFNILKWIVICIGGFLIVLYLIVILVSMVLHSQLISETEEYPCRLKIKYREFKKMKRVSKSRMIFRESGVKFRTEDSGEVFLYFGLIDSGRYIFYTMLCVIIQKITSIPGLIKESFNKTRSNEEQHRYDAVQHTVSHDKEKKKK